MRILTYVLLVLLLAAIGGAAFFYLTMYQPMTADYDRLKAGMPELDKARAELRKYKDKEKKDTAWIKPALEAFSSVLSDNIKAGTVEVLSADNRVVVNIAEQALYMPGSKTFTKESRPLLEKLDSLLRNDNLKEKNIYIGNTTKAVEARGRGRTKVPAKDARTLAVERSAELTKYLEKQGVQPDILIAAAYSSKQPAVGFNIKDKKTVIIIENPPVVPVVETKQPAPQAKPSLETKGTTTAAAAQTPSAASQTKPKPIPIRPSQAKPN
jgi:outer membrane protein OmpA-like peptidoglycan-associated protein